MAVALAFPGVGIEEMVLRSPSPVAGAAWTPEGARRERTAD
jgi:hypothetical protein